MRPAPILAALSLVALASLSGCASTEPEPEPYSADFYNNNAQRLYDGAHYRQALDQFEKALTRDPENRTALLGRAWSLVTLAEAQILNGEPAGGDNVQLALEAFDELGDIDFGVNDYKVELGLGKANVLLGDLYGVRAVRLREVVRRRPEGDPSRDKLKEAERQRDRAYRVAKRLFHRVLDTKDNEAAQTNLTALIHLARISVIEQDYPDALLYAERYLEQVRRSKDLWVESLRHYPEDKPIWESKLAGAVNKEIEVRDLIANALFKMGRLEAAEDELRHLILLAPDRADAYLNRGIVRDELGKKPEAVQDLREFLVHAVRSQYSAEDDRVIEATKRLLRLEKELGLKPTVSTEETPGADAGGAE